jgi:hypothetical protein
LTRWQNHNSSAELENTSGIRLRRSEKI